MLPAIVYDIETNHTRAKVRAPNVNSSDKHELPG